MPVASGVVHVQARLRASAVSDAELIAQALDGATPSPAVRRLARRIAAMPPWQGRLTGGLDVPAERLSARAAAQLSALYELCERWAPDDRPVIASPRDALLLLDPLRRSRRERIVVLHLDARHRPMRLETAAVGTVNASRLAVRDVFGPALQHGAVAVIVGHNHPSGDASPSRADRLVTAALRSSGDALGVAVLDHIIVSAHGHHSFRDAEGWDEEAAPDVSRTRLLR